MTESFSGYRRRVRIEPHDDRVDVDMEDDFHRFGVSLFHDGVTIERVETRTLRHPWTTCPAAGEFLVRRMAGAKLADAMGMENQRDHCTHMYDLFMLAADHALDEAPTIYDVSVSDGDGDAALSRNGEIVLRWRIDAVGVCEGVQGGTLRELDLWCRTLPREMQESARMLRRGAMVSRGRGMAFPRGVIATEFLPHMAGACFTFSPRQIGKAESVGGTIRDFSKHPETMLQRERP